MDQDKLQFPFSDCVLQKTRNENTMSRCNVTAWPLCCCFSNKETSVSVMLAHLCENMRTCITPTLPQTPSYVKKTSFFSGNTDWSYSGCLRWELLGICENSDLKFQHSSCLAKSEKKWPQSFRICWRFIRSVSGWRQVKKYGKQERNRTTWSKKDGE